MTGCASQNANVKTLRAGYDALNARQYDKAMSAADQVLAANPEKTLPAEAHYLRGRVFEARAMAASPAGAATDWQSARDEYIATLGLPHAQDLDGRARAGAANVAYHQEDYATAFQQWQEAFPKLEKPEDRALTLYRLGQCAQHLGRWEQADNYFAQVEQSAPGSDLATRAKQHSGARGYVVQLATFANAQQADQAAADARKQGVVAQSVRDPENGSHVLLRVGPFPSYAEAKALKARFASVYPNAVIVP